jgi:predicted DNA-binding transcriptional regulator AlpA
MKHILNNSKCLREKELLTVIPFSKSTLWRNVQNGTFPKPIKLSEKVTAWSMTEVEDWLSKKRIQNPSK